MRELIAGSVLVGMYAAILGSLEPLDLLTGAAVAAAAMRFRRRLRTRPVDPPPLCHQLRAIPGWIGVVTSQIIAGSAQVIRQVIRPRTATRAGIVAVPFEERTERAVALGSLVLTLSPGEVVVDIDEEAQIMWIHTMDAEDPERVRAGHSRLYEKHQRRVVP